MDWAGAAEAYRKALELDPSDVATRMDYGILLEHDEDGLRYAPDTRLEEAVEEYRKAQRQLGPRNRLDQLEANLALALLFSEKYADLEKLAARAEKSPAWRGFLVAAVAARRGVAEADPQGERNFRRRRRAAGGPGKRGRVSPAGAALCPGQRHL